MNILRMIFFATYKSFLCCKPFTSLKNLPMQKQIPLKLEYVNESIYAGFFKRLASLLLDGLILAPLTVLTVVINSYGLKNFYYTLIPNLLVGLWYMVYLVKKNGGTPGKRIMGLKILKTDATEIGWKEAMLRHSLSFLFSVLMMIAMVVSLTKADETYYLSLGWLKKQEYLQSLSPLLFMLATWINNGWFYGELIILLTNDRKRAAHDFIAGTVIVQDIYIDRIREVMSKEGSV